MLLCERFELTDKTLKLLHASPTKNRDSISNYGLMCNMNPSGYGVSPTKKAVYLYYRTNIDVPADMLKLFKEIDIWEVTINTNNLVADEDSACKRYYTSLETMGTCAYKGNISSGQIRLLGTARTIKDIKKFQSFEDY